MTTIGDSHKQQLRRDQLDTKTLVDASWALRRLTDQRWYHGLPPYVAYATCGVIDRAALNIADVEKGAPYADIGIRSIMPTSRLCRY
ncbi:MAG: hypothetical protein ACRDRO_06150 [Pseudonocardiaceae bacterium]